MNDRVVLPLQAGLKLNLGCGQNKLDGYINVDRVANDKLHPDLQHDLETFPWPWPDDSVAEIRLHHVLEHLGQTPLRFLRIMVELYRVCAPGARIAIAVPHPRHDHFLGDPTHVRVVTPEVLSLFSQANCARWAEQGAANSPLAFQLRVDFEVRETRMILDEPHATAWARKEIGAAALAQLTRECNNVIKEIRMLLEVVKPAGSQCARNPGEAPA